MFIYKNGVLFIRYQAGAVLKFYKYVGGSKIDTIP